MSFIQNYFKTIKNTAGRSDSNTAAEPAAEAPAEPVTDENAEPAAEAVEEPAAESVEEPAAEAVEEPAAEAVEEPAAEAVEEPAAVTAEATAAEAAEPVMEQTAEPVAEDAETVEYAAEPAEETAAAEPAEEDEESEAAEPAEEVEESEAAESAEPVAEAEEPVEAADAAESAEPAEETEAEEMSEKDEPAAASIWDTIGPADVFGYFREISAIPHGSYHTSELSDYLESFAKDHSLDYVRDDMGNLIISRPASKGCEGFAPIALQGHIDMVCEKDASNPIDMEKQAISLMTDGEWIWADRTTLGGDDGIAVAIMLALLVDETITCPPLECIFTVDEEVGLLGADKMNLTGLRSRRMINLDSENEGLITASCAGGAEVGLTYKAKRRDKKGEVLTLSVKGLRGGHSGECINCGRANADILLACLLYRLEKVGKYCIIGINGGLRDNAIPREAKAEIIFTGNFKHREVKEAVQSFADDIAREYSVTDPDIHIHAEWANKGKIITRIAFGRKDSRRLVRFLMAIPNGLIETSALYKDVPQTSLNLGILKTMAEGFHMVSMVRSSINSQKQMLLDRIACIADEFGISMAVEGVYPAWELIEQSDFRDLAADVYQQLTGKKAEVCVIHGGLECGLLAAKVPGLDCISIGPDMEGVHTPSERLNIPSSKRTYDYIKSILEVCTKQ